MNWKRRIDKIRYSPLLLIGIIFHKSINKTMNNSGKRFEYLERAAVKMADKMRSISREARIKDIAEEDRKADEDAKANTLAYQALTKCGYDLEDIHWIYQRVNQILDFNNHAEKSA